MIGTYLGNETPVVAVDGKREDVALDSFAGSETACHAVVPISADITSVAEMLRQLQQHKLSVQALHDAAALAVASLGFDGTALFVEIAEEAGAVARVVTTEGEVRRQALLKRERGGRRALRRVWTDLIAESMVLSHRFDPLYDRDSESRLSGLLWDAARCAAEEGSVLVTLPTPRGDCSITLTRDQFAVSAASIYRDLSSMLHELRPAASRVDLLVMEKDLSLPGFTDMLAEFRGCRVVAIDAEQLALAASRQTSRLSGDDEVLLLRGYPRSSPLIEARIIGSTQTTSLRTRPTHLIWNTEVKPLEAGATIEIGRAVAPNGLVLPEGLAGVSRWHCSLRHETLTTWLIDHSRHGTWLNDERVLGRAEVFTGDRIRIGDPGIELTLLAIETGNGAPAR